MASVTMGAYQRNNANRARRRALEAKKNALASLNADQRAEQNALFAARQAEQETFGGNSLRMMLCGPPGMVMDMKGKDGAALTFADSGEVYVYDHEAGEGCQVRGCLCGVSCVRL